MKNMKNLHKFENYDNVDISWNTEGIKGLIKYYDEELKEEQESSHFPESEEEQINRNEECQTLLKGMIDKNSWYYKKFNKI
jgi:hypothetical protein